MPRQVDHEQRRREIVAATWAAIDDLGVEGATMRSIAQRAGCTTGRITHHFGSRDDVLVTALRHAHGAAGRRMRAIVDARPAGLDTLRAVLAEALPLDATRRLEWKVWLAFWALSMSSEQLREEQAARVAEWRGLVDEVLAAAGTDASGPTSRRAGVVDALVAVVDGLGIEATTSARPITARRLGARLDAALATLGLASPPDRRSGG